jgi:hypothetical protein
LHDLADDDLDGVRILEEGYEKLWLRGRFAIDTGFVWLRTVLVVVVTMFLVTKSGRIALRAAGVKVLASCYWGWFHDYYDSLN